VLSHISQVQHRLSRIPEISAVFVAPVFRPAGDE
jgi:hypothetical protein